MTVRLISAHVPKDESLDVSGTDGSESVTVLVAEERTSTQAFRFWDLPSELRSEILSISLLTHNIIDLHPQNHCFSQSRLNTFLVSHRMHKEASRIFYSRNTFRIFPTHGRYFGNKVVPLVARLPQRYRTCLTSLELRLGPGWSDPPKSWQVHGGLGLEEMKNARELKIVVEVDPSQDFFKGFRAGKNFYTEFSRALLSGVIQRLPSLQSVEFDGWPSVLTKGGTLMSTLVQQAKAAGIKVCWSNNPENLDETEQFWQGEKMEGILAW